MKKTTLVLGASLNEFRYSNMAIKRLVNAGYSVVAIGNRKGFVDGVEIIKSKDLFQNIDTISLYLNAKNQESFYNYILALKPKRVIFNPGTENKELEVLLEKHNIYFESACTLVLLSTNTY